MFDALKKETGQKTVPYNYVNGELLGGCDDLKKLQVGGWAGGQSKTAVIWPTNRRRPASDHDLNGRRLHDRGRSTRAPTRLRCSAWPLPCLAWLPPVPAPCTSTCMLFTSPILLPLHAPPPSPGCRLAGPKAGRRRRRARPDVCTPSQAGAQQSRQGCRRQHHCHRLGARRRPRICRQRPRCGTRGRCCTKCFSCLRGWRRTSGNHRGSSSGSLGTPRASARNHALAASTRPPAHQLAPLSAHPPAGAGEALLPDDSFVDLSLKPATGDDTPPAPLCLFWFPEVVDSNVIRLTAIQVRVCGAASRRTYYIVRPQGTTPLARWPGGGGQQRAPPDSQHGVALPRRASQAPRLRTRPRPAAPLTLRPLNRACTCVPPAPLLAKTNLGLFPLSSQVVVCCILGIVWRTHTWAHYLILGGWGGQQGGGGGGGNRAWSETGAARGTSNTRSCITGVPRECKGFGHPTAPLTHAHPVHPPTPITLTLGLPTCTYFAHPH